MRLVSLLRRSATRSMWYIVCCTWYIVCSTWYIVCCMWYIVCCTWYIVCCTLSVARCLSHVVCRTLDGLPLQSSAARAPSRAAGSGTASRGCTSQMCCAAPPKSHPSQQLTHRTEWSREHCREHSYSSPDCVGHSVSTAGAHSVCMRALGRHWVGLASFSNRVALTYTCTYLDRLPVQLLRVLETVLDECDEVGVAAQAERRLRPAAHRRKQRLHCTHYGTGPHGLPHIAWRCRRVLSSTHCMRESLRVCTPWAPRLVYR